MKVLARSCWHGAQLSARESGEYFERQYGEFYQILSDLGMAKGARPAK